MKEKKDIKITIVHMKELKGADYNPRKWDDAAVDNLKASILKFGVVDPVIVNSAPKRKNVVIGGHFRLHVLKQIGWTAVPVVYVNVPDLAAEKELNLRLNKNAGEWDYALLARLDESILKAGGFTAQDLDKIFRDNAGPDADAAPSLPAKTKVKVGDIYQVGGQRVMCGDARNPAHMRALMAGKQADMVFIDPPYNVDYLGHGKKTSVKIAGDNQLEQDFRKFLTDIFNACGIHTKPSAALYTCYASRTHREFEDSLNTAGWTVVNQIIWVKTVASMGWGDYRWKHEPILYCKKSNAKGPEFFGDRTQYTEWHEDLTDEELLKRVKSMITKQESGQGTVIKLSREYEYKHPTQKPVKLISIALYNSSKRGDIVLDICGGSGSTAIAAHNTDRMARVMEIDPAWTEVAVQRLEEFTGKKALKVQ